MQRQPHVVVFLTDDHAQWAVGCYGSESVWSPTMDWIAGTGMRFANAFTPTPVCSPARASFWTGKLASAHGVHDYIDELGVAADHPGITGQTNLAMCLRDAGYHTAMVGKWHCNNFRSPPDGFDRWFTLADGTNAKFGRQRFYDQDRLVEKHGHQAPMLTDEAVKVIQGRPEDQPLFLFVGYTDTHTPHNAQPPRLVERYLEHDFADVPLDALTENHGYTRIRQTRNDAERRAQLADYFASVTTIDEQVGRVVDELRNAGMLDDTLLVYTSDHGHMNGQHGLHSKGNATIPQNLLEESIRVPHVVRWPGVIEPGQVSEKPVDHCDLFATLVDVAGAAVKDDAARPGVSLRAIYESGDAAAWRDAQFCEYGNARMVRTARYKLIRRAAGPNGDWPDALYDLADDPAEECNVIDDPAHADLIATLDARLTEHFAKYETLEHAGTRIAEQHLCNHWQPWDLSPEECARRLGRSE